MDIKKAATSREKNIHKVLALTGQDFVGMPPTLWVKNKKQKMYPAISNPDIHKLLNLEESVKLAKENNIIALVIQGWASESPDINTPGVASRMTIVGSPDGWYTIVRISDNPTKQIHETMSINSSIHELLMELISTAQTTRRV